MQPKVDGAGITATATVNQPAKGMPGVYSTTTDIAGNYTLSSLLVPDVYDLTFTVDTTRFIANPPKLLCDGGLTGLSLTGQGQNITRRIGLYRIYGGWWQNIGGDIYGDTGVSTAIPATCMLAENATTCNSYDVSGTYYTPLIITPDYGGTPGSSGMVFTRTGTLSLGGDGAPAPNATYSEAGYNSTDTGYAGRRYDYGYFYRWLGNLGFTTWDGVGKPTGSNNALYLHSGSLTWTQSLDANEKIVLLVDGDVTINTDIDVPVGAYLSIIASGDINITANVVRVEGHYVADEITLESTGDKATDQRFIGEGSFIGWEGILLERDRGITNNSESAELFIFRPDLVINAPRGVRNPNINWQEVAP